MASGCYSLTFAMVLGIAVAWEALFVYDATIFALTLYKACQSRSMNRVLRSNSVLTVIFRDGEWRTHFDDIVSESCLYNRRSLFRVRKDLYINERCVTSFCSIIATVQLANVLTFYVSNCLDLNPSPTNTTHSSFYR